MCPISHIQEVFSYFLVLLSSKEDEEMKEKKN